MTRKKPTKLDRMAEDARKEHRAGKTKPLPAKKRLSGRGCRAKGVRGETELVEILTKSGIPTQRVVASGSFIGAKSDLKVGVELNKDGTMPDRDEGRCIGKAEVKNRADNPEWVFQEVNRACPEAVFKHLNQDKVSKYLIMRRKAIPQGALAKEEYNQTHVVAMGLEDFMELFKLAYGEHYPTSKTD